MTGRRFSRCIAGALHLLCVALTCVRAHDSSEFSRDKMLRYRERVRAMFYHAYNGYLEYAYPFDELQPLSCKGTDTWGSFSLTLVDALDTLVLLGNGTEFERASRLVLKSIDFDANVNVSVFETNIRVVGGLLSAHMLSGVAGVQLEEGWPCSGPLLRLAERVADKLLPAFNTYTGMPFGTVNLRYGVHNKETPITCTAGVGTFLLEFGTLSRLTGNAHYERVAMKALKELWLHRSAIGLVGNHINVQTGQWTATDAGIGAGVDSYFEYLVKGAMLFNRPSLMRQFNAYRKSIEQYVMHDGWFMWVSMINGAVTMPVFQSLEQFWPGVLSLMGDTASAKEIMLNYAQILRQYGFSPEFYNVPNSEAMQKRSGYPLRPEFIESLYYLYQSTGDPIYLQIGADAFEAIEHSTKTACGYATVHNVKDHTLEDRMESFFLAETTKYLYLLFDPDDNLFSGGGAAGGIRGRIVRTPSGGECVVETRGAYVFNTEAHPFDMSIVHCCSVTHAAEVETLARFHDHMDLLAVFGLDALDGEVREIDNLTEEEEEELWDGQSRDELLGELSLPMAPKVVAASSAPSSTGVDSNLTMVGNGTDESTHRKSTVATVPGSETEVDIEYEIDEKYLTAEDEEDLKEDETLSRGGQATPSPTARKVLSVEDEDSDEADREDQSEATTNQDGRPAKFDRSAQVKSTDERTLRLAGNVENQSVRVKQTATNQKRAQPTREKSGGHEEKSINSVSYSKSMSAREDFGSFLRRVASTKHGAQSRSPLPVDRKCTLRPMIRTGGGADVPSPSADAVAKALRDVLEAALKPSGTSVDEFLRSVEDYLVSTHALSAASHGYSADDEEATVCRPYDVVTSSRLFSSFLHLVYDRRPSIRSLLRHPACLASAPAAEEDDYDRSLPPAGRGTSEEESGAGREIPLSADLRRFKTRELAELQFELMSCARRPFATARLSRMGEVVR